MGALEASIRRETDNSANIDMYLQALGVLSVIYQRPRREFHRAEARKEPRLVFDDELSMLIAP